jgi:tRNA dimethylallyltransferase
VTDVIAVVGPTAVGKSAVAIALARALAPGAAEIVNADAMQLYRGMDIGTGKVLPDDRTCVPHHLFDVWPVTHRASVVEYRDIARPVLTDIVRRSAAPIMVGGSGLYLRAVLDDMDVPATDPRVRAEWEARLAQQGPAAMHAELAARDPAAAQHIDPNNGRRIVRALEVVDLTGSFTSRLPATPAPWTPTRWIGLSTDLPALDAAIDARVAAMWTHGLPQEVARLATLGLRDGPTAGRAIGYAECLSYLDGTISQEQAVAATALRTRQLARRQLRWFRRDARTRWVHVDPSAPPSDTAGRIIEILARDG